jgi:hypothetical protein
VKGVYLASEAATGKCFVRRWRLQFLHLPTARNRP